MKKLNIVFSILIISAIIVTIIVVVVFVSNKNNNIEQEVSDQELESVLDSIDLGNDYSKTYSNKYRVNKQTMGTYTVDDFELMNKYASRKDLVSYQNLYLNGKAIILNEGDICKAIDIDVLKIQCECNTPEGKETVWISSEFLD